MNTAQFSKTTKVFHWLTALLILTIIPLGAIAARLPVETDAQIALKALLFSLHKTLGIAVFFVALARIAYAFSQSKPGPLHPERKIETLLAEVVHWLLYVSLVLVPLTGWVHHASASVAAPIWLPFAGDLPFVPKDPAVSQLFGGLHWVWSKIMVASILLHVAGAFKHHLIDRDSTLRRMWFGAAAGPDSHRSRSFAPAGIALAIYIAVTVLGAASGMFSHTTGPSSLDLRTAPSEWTVQEGKIGLTVEQFGNRVSGEFENWAAAIQFDERNDGIAGVVTTTIDISSLNLGTLSNQAMGPDFFDQGTFPTAVFTGDIIKENGAYRADGALTIKGTSQPLSFPFDLDIVGGTATMSAQLTTDRTVFGIGASVTDQSNLANGVAVSIALTAAR